MEGEGEGEGEENALQGVEEDLYLILIMEAEAKGGMEKGAGSGNPMNIDSRLVFVLLERILNSML